MLDTSDLLSRFVSTRSETAFQLIVEQTLPVVLSASLPCVGGDRQLAEDAAQLVYVSLAKKAPRLPKEVRLRAWLYRHAFHTASKLARGERRRARRETTYATTAMKHSEPDTDDLAEVLPRLLSEISESDRDLVIARFFEEQSFRMIGDVYAISEDTAQKRVSRALERIRKKLAAAGITSSMALLADMLASQRVPPPSTELVARIQSECQSVIVAKPFLGIGVPHVLMLGGILAVVAVGASVWWSEDSDRTANGNSDISVSASSQSIVPAKRILSHWQKTSPEAQITELTEALKRVLAWLHEDYGGQLLEYQALMEQDDVKGGQMAKAGAKKTEVEIQAMRVRMESWLLSATRAVNDVDRVDPVHQAMITDNIPWIPEMDYGDNEERILVERITSYLTRMEEQDRELEIRESLEALVAKVGEDHFLVHQLSAQELWMLGDRQGAYDILAEAHERHPDETPWLAQFQGDLHFRNGDYEKAVEQYASVNNSKGIAVWSWNRWLAEHLVDSPSAREFMSKTMLPELLPEMLLLEAVRAQVAGDSEQASVWVREARGLDAQVTSSQWINVLVQEGWQPSK